MRSLALICLIVTASTAFAQKITLEFDEATDFSDYRTFRLAEGALHSKNPSLNNDLVRRKLDSEIRARLTAKGLTETETRPDLVVRFSLGSGRRTEVDAYPAGWRGTRLVRTHFAEGTLIIDLRDTRKKELVWRAIATEEKRDPMQLKDHLDDMVRKSIDKYPPKRR